MCVNDAGSARRLDGSWVSFPTPRDKSRGTISRLLKAAGFNPRDRLPGGWLARRARLAAGKLFSYPRLVQRRREHRFSV